MSSTEKKSKGYCFPRQWLIDNKSKIHFLEEIKQLPCFIQGVKKQYRNLRLLGRVWKWFSSRLPLLFHCVIFETLIWISKCLSEQTV